MFTNLTCNVDYWESCVRAFKKREALVFEDKSYTYEQLDNEANKIANWASSENVKAGDTIALYMTVWRLKYLVDQYYHRIDQSF